jgi:hypothetical protein
LEIIVTIDRSEELQRADEGTAPFSRWEKMIGVCLLVVYLAMIGVTIATSPYVVANRNIFERASGSF